MENLSTQSSFAGTNDHMRWLKISIKNIIILFGKTPRETTIPLVHGQGFMSSFSCPIPTKKLIKIKNIINYIITHILHFW